MIVVDASATAEVLLRRPLAPAVERVLVGEELHAPEHFRIEVISALRRATLRAELSEAGAARALLALRHLRTAMCPTGLLQDEIWDLRHCLTAYDAAYLALARRVDAPLVTLDAGLAAVARDEGRRLELT